MNEVNEWLSIWMLRKWLDELEMHRVLNIFCYMRVTCNVLMIFIATFMYMHGVAMVVDNGRAVRISVTTVISMSTIITVTITIVLVDWFCIRFWSILCKWLFIRLNMMHWLMIHRFDIWLWRKWFDEIEMHRCINVFSLMDVTSDMFVVLISTFMNMYCVAMVVNNWRVVRIYMACIDLSCIRVYYCAIRLWFRIQRRIIPHWFNVCWLVVTWLNVCWFMVDWLVVNWLSVRLRGEWFVEFKMHRRFNVFSLVDVTSNVLVVLISAFVHMHCIAVVVDNGRLFVGIWCVI